MLRHKWFVLVAGMRVGAPLWRLLVHDWTKFLPSEWGPYVASFYGPWAYRDRPAEVVAAFDHAWNLHQKRHPHHWQFWLLVEDNPTVKRFGVVSPECLVDYSIVEHALFPRGELWFRAEYTDDGRERLLLAQRVVDAANRYRALAMPEHYIREMVADWMGAGRVITGRWEVGEWYRKNRDIMVLHDTTRIRVEQLLGVI